MEMERCLGRWLKEMCIRDSMNTCALAILVSCAPPEQLGRVLGLTSIGVYSGLSLGPGLSGLLGLSLIHISFDPRKIREVLGIPENLEPLLVLALGFQKEVRRVETVGADGSVKYWRDAQGVHHVPKRPLEDLLIIKK